MANGDINWIAGFIWSIADDVLRDVYVRGKYRDVILPMTVIRRLDAVLEPTKEAVLRLNQQLDAAGVANKHAALCQAAGNAFYNISPFTLKDLRARAKQQQLKADFEAYLDGFSPNVQEILEKFKFRNQITTLVEADVLGSLIEKFTSNDVNLSPDPVFDQDGNVRLPGLDNHAMGTIFEELIRRFNEENNEEAGEHFTPRDVVKLMANLIFRPIADNIQDATYRVYDGACGTGGMLTVAEETLDQLAQEHGKEVSIHLFGQEINPETYAISKADLLLNGEGQGAENIKYGSTLSSDAFPAMEFDFMLSNPPYGKSWKTDLERMGGKKDLADQRFVVQHKGEELSLITRSSDGQLMFLVNKLTKMNHHTPLGSRIAEVHNGSSLFTGDAGQGESNIRRWIMENDWLEAIIALPLNMFYNTGIATYIWVLTNRKPEHRRGQVQLIDATGIFQPLRKNLGKKNCELSDEQIRQIIEMFLAFEETGAVQNFSQPGLRLLEDHRGATPAPGHRPERPEAGPVRPNLPRGQRGAPGPSGAAGGNAARPGAAPGFRPRPGRVRSGCRPAWRQSDRQAPEAVPVRAHRHRCGRGAGHPEDQQAGQGGGGPAVRPLRGGNRRQAQGGGVRTG